MKKKAAAKGKAVVATTSLPPVDMAFGEVLHLIQAARQRAYQAVNTELVTLYWQVGEYISGKLRSAEWGDKVVDELARFLAGTQPGLRGFTRRNLFRMRQFYECYRDQPIVSALLAQLPWTHHLLILSYSKREEEREFYIRLAIHEKWSSRELERQFRSGRFERTVLNPIKLSTALREMYPQSAGIFKDIYTLEFLGLPAEHSEADLHGGLLRNLGRFITELGRDFCYISEYALSRTISPAMIAEYKTQLPDKELLRAKLHEFYNLLAPPEDEEGEAKPPKKVAKTKRKGGGT